MEFFIIITMIVVIVLFYKIYEKTSYIEDQLYDISNNLHRHIRDTEMQAERPEIKTETVACSHEEDESSEELALHAETKPEPEAAPVVPVETFEPPTFTEQPVEEVEAADTEEPSRSIRIEKLIGENLMGKIGILALVVGIGFFVKLAIDNNWINEWSRTILGIAAGGVLWAVAYRIRDSYRNFSSVLAGGGFAVSFVTIAVAYNFYRLFPAAVTLGLFVALCAAMTWMAMRYDRRELAVMAVVGGYVAPFLSAGPSGSFFMLLCYTALLTGVMSYISYRRQWWLLPAVGMAATWLIVVISANSVRLTSANGAMLAGFCTVFYTLLSLPVATILRRFQGSDTLFMIILGEVALNQIAYLVFGIDGMDANPALRHVRGLIPLYVAILNGILFWKFYRNTSARIVADILRWCVILGFGLFLPVQFESLNTVGSALALYALLLTVVFIRSGNRLYFRASTIAIVFDFIVLSIGVMFWGRAVNKGFAELISGAAYMATAYLLAWHSEVYGQPERMSIKIYKGIVLNVGWLAVAQAGAQFGHILFPAIDSFMQGFTCAMLVMIVVALLWQPSRVTAGFMPVIGLMWLGLLLAGEYVITAGLVAALWLGLIAFGIATTFFIKKMSKASACHIDDNYILYFSIIAAIFIIETCVAVMFSCQLPGYYSAAVSVGLIIAGAAIMAAGLKYHRLKMRITSICLFGILILKLVIYDLWLLPMIGRIIVFILLGVVLLTLSFLYQKLKTKIFSPDQRG